MSYLRSPPGQRRRARPLDASAKPSGSSASTPALPAQIPQCQRRRSRRGQSSVINARSRPCSDVGSDGSRRPCELPSRIRGRYDVTEDNPAAVAGGVHRPGGVITSAALLLIIVVGISPSRRDHDHQAARRGHDCRAGRERHDRAGVLVSGRHAPGRPGELAGTQFSGPTTPGTAFTHMGRPGWAAPGFPVSTGRQRKCPAGGPASRRASTVERHSPPGAHHASPQAAFNRYRPGRDGLRASFRSSEHPTASEV